MGIERGSGSKALSRTAFAAFLASDEPSDWCLDPVKGQIQPIHPGIFWPNFEGEFSRKKYISYHIHDFSIQLFHGYSWVVLFRFSHLPKEQQGQEFFSFFSRFFLQFVFISRHKTVFAGPFSTSKTSSDLFQVIPSPSLSQTIWMCRVWEWAVLRMLSNMVCVNWQRRLLCFLKGQENLTLKMTLQIGQRKFAITGVWSWKINVHISALSIELFELKCGLCGTCLITRPSVLHQEHNLFRNFSSHSCNFFFNESCFPRLKKGFQLA